MKTKLILTALAVVAMGATVQATTVTYTFLENGQNLSLGASSTFVESGVGLTAYAEPAGQSLYAKYTSGNPGETGLGLLSDLPDHEIESPNFVQLASGFNGLTLTSLGLGSVQQGESATIYYSTVLGSLGTLIGTVTSNGSFSLAGLDPGAGYVTVSAGGGDVLITSATGNVSVPDGASTVLLLGSTLTALGMIKRKIQG